MYPLPVPAAPKPVHILLVEDSPSDAKLIMVALRDSTWPVQVSHVMDGEKALDFLRRRGAHADAERPDIVVLDLNLPRKNGWEVLAEVKEDADLRAIPVAVLTTSAREEDVRKTYGLHANCYIQKPLDLFQFMEAVRKLQEFWRLTVRLPHK